jgi:hypothetical protein
MKLPQVTEEPHFKYTSFRVCGRIFVTAPPDGRHIHIFVPDEQREQALATHPEFLEKLLWGKKVVGLRVLLAAASPAVVHQLVSQAWASKAPKRLLPGAQ